MQSSDSLEKMSEMSFLSDSELEAMLYAESASLGLGDIPRDMELPFEDLVPDCYVYDEGRVESEMSEISLGASHVDHAYDRPECGEDQDDQNELTCAAAMEQNVRRASQRPKRNATKKRYSVSSVESEVSEAVYETKKPSSRNAVDTYSENDDSKFGDKSMSKNAIAARENRQKKKMYMSNLETSTAQLKKENQLMKAQLKGLTQNNEALIGEVSYLRGVLSNVDAVSALIRTIHKTPGIKEITTSLGVNLKKQGKRKVTNEDEPARKSARIGGTKAEGNTGICLHVANGAVSLEFWMMCSNSAKKGYNS